MYDDCVAVGRRHNSTLSLSAEGDRLFSPALSAVPSSSVQLSLVLFNIIRSAPCMDYDIRGRFSTEEIQCITINARTGELMTYCKVYRAPLREYLYIVIYPKSIFYFILDITYKLDVSQYYNYNPKKCISM